MILEEVEAYLGIPYKEGSFGPDSYNCWGLLHHIQKTYFNTDLPIAPIGDAERCQRMFKDRVEAKVWAIVENPVHGDGALMRPGKNPHVGIYLDFDGGGILHALEGIGVVFTPCVDLNYHGFGRVKYYRLNNVH